MEYKTNTSQVLIIKAIIIIDKHKNIYFLGNKKTNFIKLFIFD